LRRREDAPWVATYLPLVDLQNETPNRVSDPFRLFLWEAFVSAAAKAATHIDDATIAVHTAP
jgi:hypothetical protein